MSMSNVIIIGEGKMALDCARLAAQHGGVRLAALVGPKEQGGSRLRAFADKVGAELIAAADPNEANVVRELRRLEPDIVFSINNYRVLGSKLLATAGRGAVNFHNGPLPRYAGVNIPSWVIWNGERRHGVTWHYMDRGVDTGDVVAQVHFDLGGEETAAELNFRCIAEGTSVFPGVLDAVLSGSSARRPQTGERLYFGRGDVPNGGYVDLTWEAGTLRRFLRATSFRPFPSPFGPLKLRTPAGDLRFETAAVIAGGESGGRRAMRAPGTIVAIEEDALTVSVTDTSLRIEHGVDSSDRHAAISELCRQLRLSSGDRLIDAS
jgi:methionyl-tRNA formyltransferase